METKTIDRAATENYLFRITNSIDRKSMKKGLKIVIGMMLKCSSSQLSA